jgi:hypothetical protein
MRDACGGGFSSRLSPRSVPDCEIFTRFGPVLGKKTRVSTAPESVPPSHCAGGGAPGGWCTGQGAATSYRTEELFLIISLPGVAFSQMSSHPRASLK